MGWELGLFVDVGYELKQKRSVRLPTKVGNLGTFKLVRIEKRLEVCDELGPKWKKATKKIPVFWVSDYFYIFGNRTKNRYFKFVSY